MRCCDGNKGIPEPDSAILIAARDSKGVKGPWMHRRDGNWTKWEKTRSAEMYRPPQDSRPSFMMFFKSTSRAVQDPQAAYAAQI